MRLSIRTNPVVCGFPKQNAKSVIGNVSRTWFFLNSYYYSDARRIPRILLLLYYSGTENAHPQLRANSNTKGIFIDLSSCACTRIIYNNMWVRDFRRSKNENFHQTRPVIRDCTPENTSTPDLTLSRISSHHLLLHWGSYYTLCVNLWMAEWWSRRGEKAHT